MIKLLANEKMDEKGAKIPKLGFLLGAMRTQERPYVRKILHAYVGWNLRMNKLKNIYMFTRQAYVCMNQG